MLAIVIPALCMFRQKDWEFNMCLNYKRPSHQPNKPHIATVTSSLTRMSRIYIGKKAASSKHCAWESGCPPLEECN